MATTHANSQWHNKIETQKGDYGEQLVQKIFEDNGYIVYKPVTDGAHGFDRILYKDGHYSALEVKTKPMCRKYPETGFDKRLYDRYCRLSEENNLPTFIAFVDDEKRAIYGNYLHELCKPRYVDYLGAKGHYPKYQPHTGGNTMTVYFHKDSMKHLRDLTDSEVETLKSF